jgi:hypothetical protein
MMIAFRAIATLLPVIGLGFSCGGGRSPRGHACDGSASLRLAMARISSPDRLQAGQQVMFENGSVFLYVDGHCGYWAQTEDVWAGTHSGLLTEAQAGQVERDVHYADWFSGDWKAPTLVDGSFDLLYDTSVKLSCSSLCGSSAAPAFVKDVTARFEELIRPLWNAGAPIGDDGVRIIAVRLDPGAYAFVPHASWPLAADLKRISQDPGAAQLQGYGHGILFQGSDATQLRALRTIYQGGNYRQLGVPGLPVDDRAGAGYLLFVRDALPFEDSLGLVRPSF